MMTPSDVTRIRNGLTTYLKSEYAAIKGYVDHAIAYIPASSMATNSQNYFIVESASFVALISNDATYKSKAISYALAMAAISATADSDQEQHFRLEALSFCYDWLYSDMTAADRTTILNAIAAHLIQLDYMVDFIDNSGGHSRFGTTALMAGAIAILGESVQGVDAPGLLNRVNNRFLTGFNPFQEWAVHKGAYPMGWRYTAFETNPLPYLIWEKATGITWANELRSQQSLFYIYGLRGDSSWPRTGDAWNVVLQDVNIVDILAQSSGRYKDAYAEWFIQKYWPTAWGPTNIIRMIYKDPNVTPKSPEGNLPNAQLFENSGFVVMRDHWDENTTELIFKSSSFYTRTHHHKDQNHIELSYKGSLLTDSGEYDSYSTTHWKNYYTRTIAHNTMVAYDPAETYNYLGTVSNDGGQIFPNYYAEPVGFAPVTLEQALTPKYTFTGITGFGSAEKCYWTRGDATKAYNSAKVESYIRDVVMVSEVTGRDHPVALVLDRVKLKKSLKPTILYHMKQQPEISGRYFKVTNAGGGVLHADVLLPSDAALTAVGGAGKEFLVSSVNYPPQNNWTASDTEPGSWRTEVTTSQNTTEATFLTLLSVDDQAALQGRPAGSVLSDNGYAGVMLGDKTLIIIAYSDAPPTTWTISSTDFQNLTKVYIAGLTSNSGQTLIINGATYTTQSINGVASFTVTPGSIVTTTTTPTTDTSSTTSTTKTTKAKPTRKNATSQ